MKTITVEQLQQLHESDNSVTLIDVRTPAEFRAKHVSFAANIPLGAINENALAEMGDHDGTIYVICRSGGRSAMACGQVAKLGRSNIINVEGGMMAWARAGFPVESDGSSGSPFSIFSPAGFLIVAGIILTLTVHSGFIAIPALVGLYMMNAGRKAKSRSPEEDT